MLPTIEVVTNVLPTRDNRDRVTTISKSGESTSKNNLGNVQSSTSIVLVRKIPFMIRHNGKIKKFNISENRTVLELQHEIRSMSNCKGSFKIDFIPQDVDTSIILKTFHFWH